jgi:hypothetical protein
MIIIPDIMKNRSLVQKILKATNGQTEEVISKH